jgi:putative ABC transport system permease protein
MELNRMKNSIRLPLFLATKNILHQKVLYALIVLIIMLSFVSATVVSATILGFVNTINNQIIEYSHGGILIEPREDEIYIDDALLKLDKIRRVPGVTAATRRYSLPATLFKKDRQTAGFGFFAIDPVEEKKVTFIYRHMRKGEYLTPKDSGEIIIGSEIAGGGEQIYFGEEDTLSAGIGDIIRVSFANGVEKEFRTKGIFNPRDVYSPSFAYITIDDAEEILGESGKASLIVVRVPKGTEDYYIKRFKELGINDVFKTWEDKLSTSKVVISIFGTINILLSTVGLFIVFVTVFVIIYINLAHKRRQIGILKAIGINETVITQSYTIQSMIYGVSGIIGGGVLIWAMTAYWAVHPLDTPFGLVAPELSSYSIVMASTMLLISSIIGGYIPSLKASKEDIIKLIWD